MSRKKKQDQNTQESQAPQTSTGSKQDPSHPVVSDTSAEATDEALELLFNAIRIGAQKQTAEAIQDNAEDFLADYRAQFMRHCEDEENAGKEFRFPVNIRLVIRPKAGDTGITTTVSWGIRKKRQSKELTVVNPNQLLMDLESLTPPAAPPAE